MSTIEVYYFAAARDAAGAARETVTAPETLGELAEQLAAAHSGRTRGGMTLREVLGRCTFLVDAARAEPATALRGASRVDVLPPFAGG